MSNSTVEFIDGKPPIGDQYRFVDSPLGRGVLLPYVAFDPEYGAAIAQTRERSRSTGVLPMALIVPGVTRTAIGSSMYTHHTPTTRFLDGLQVGIMSGRVHPMAYDTLLRQVLFGEVIICEVNPESPDNPLAP